MKTIPLLARTLCHTLPLVLITLGLAGASPAGASERVDDQAAHAVPELEEAAAAEGSVAELTRAALAEPESLERWARLAHELRSLRPEAWRDVPTSAERVAHQTVESLAASTPGAIRELRVEPGDGRTEVALAVTGEVRHRLFRRLANTDDPRLTVSLHDADATVLEPLYAGIDRGGVRELRVNPTDSGTVEIAIALAEPAAFSLGERDGEIIVGIAHDGDFEPWSSRPAWSRKAPQRWGTALAGLPAGPSAVSDDVLASTLPDVANTGGTTSAPRRGSNVASIRTRIGAYLPTGVDPLLALGGAVSAVAALLILALSLRTRSRGRGRARGDQTNAATMVTGRSAETRLVTARSLAVSGASKGEIARHTGLAQDAVALLTRANRERGAPAAPESAARGTGVKPHRRRASPSRSAPSAGSGTFFRPQEAKSQRHERGAGNWGVA